MRYCLEFFHSEINFNLKSLLSFAHHCFLYHSLSDLEALSHDLNLYEELICMKFTCRLTQRCFL